MKSYKPGEDIKVGPFTWRRDDHGGCEVWELMSLPPNVGMTHFCLKNYGGKPNDHSPFSGWRLASGGPFCSAGGWTSRDAAMRGVVKFLVSYYRGQIAEKLKEARKIRAVLGQFDRSLKDDLRTFRPRTRR